MHLRCDRAARAAFLATALLGLAACNDQSRTGLPTDAGTSLVSSQDPAERVVARLLAAALRDPQLRAELKRDLAASPVHSDKLYLSGYLRGDGAALLKGMARAGATSESHVFALLGSMPALEIYLPVDEHRTLWDGGEDLIVAASLDEENAPFAVRLSGQPVALSVVAPPSTPTVAIVPAESFNDAGAAFDWGLKKSQPALRNKLSAGGPRYNTTTGCAYNNGTEAAIWQRGMDVEEFMSCVRAFNDHEPWWKDDAEFTILIAGTNDADAEAEFNTAINIPPSVWTNGGGDNSWKSLSTPIKVGWWNSNFGTQVNFRCLERDGGSTYTFKVTGSTKFGKEPLQTTVGFEHGWSYRDDDDNCGAHYMTLRRGDESWTLIPNGTSPVYEGTSDLQWYGYGVQR